MTVGTEVGGYRCEKHHPATMMLGFGKLALGLPKGFHRLGKCGFDMRLFEKPEDAKDLWDHLNVPVWAMEKDGYLFVRTYAPRVNETWVDVVKEGTLGLVPKAINVGEFFDDID